MESQLISSAHPNATRKRELWHPTDRSLALQPVPIDKMLRGFCIDEVLECYEFLSVYGHVRLQMGDLAVVHDQELIWFEFRDQQLAVYDHWAGRELTLSRESMPAHYYWLLASALMQLGLKKTAGFLRQKLAA